MDCECHNCNTDKTVNKFKIGLTYAATPPFYIQDRNHWKPPGTLDVKSKTFSTRNSNQQNTTTT